MSRIGPLRDVALLSLAVLIAVLPAPSLSAAAQPAADYCALLTKDDVESALRTRLTKVAPSPLEPIASTQMRDQTCTFEAGPRILRVTVTETRSPSEAQNIFNIDVMGHAATAGARPAALPGIGDQAVVAADAVVMQKGRLVLDFSVAAFGDSDADRLAMAKTLAAKAAEKIK